LCVPACSDIVYIIVYIPLQDIFYVKSGRKMVGFKYYTVVNFHNSLYCGGSAYVKLLHQVWQLWKFIC